MRVLLLSDRSFANREHGLLRRLKVGLLDHGVNVVHAVPDAILKNAPSDLTSVITYDDEGRYFTPAARAASCLRELGRLPLPETNQPTTGPIDIVDVWGDDAWSLGLHIARSAQAFPFFQVWSRSSAEQVARIEREAKREDADAAGAWIAPDQVMAEQLRGRVRWNVHALHWGVHARPEPRPFQYAPDRPLAACILSTGADTNACIHMLEGLARFGQAVENLLIFVDEAAVNGHPKVWKTAGALGIRDRLSVIADMESRRDLILRTDLMLIPERIDAHRSIILEAMAGGMVIVTRRTEWIDAINDDNALIVAADSAGAWEQALRSVIEDQARTTTRIRAAHACVSGSHQAWRQIEHCIRLYESVFSDEPIAFPG